ncbi:tRNA (N(6)-L-threonylcarbamoyladenosine(37)-C(2))-methylthiotransferase MtaB [bacterium]|nr:tRNA (N(6)-L-threonylcarbamoyladenosine(37)-C(2))-methylthiotransferase MtaB [bacterium]
MKIGIKTFGCKLNQYEGEGIREVLIENGNQIIPDDELADFYIINGCSVTKRAEQKAFQFIRKIKRKFPSSRVILTGCLGTQAQRGIIEAHEVDYVIPNSKKYLIDTVISGGEESIAGTDDIKWYDIKNFSEHTRAFVKIQDGCDNRCAYCIVPIIRGDSRSRPIDEIIKQVQKLHKAGFKEVVLTGVNIGSYRHKQAGNVFRLEDLLQKLLAETEIQRIRLSSMEIDEITENLVKVIESGGTRIMHHFHLPLQSGSDEILRRMKRKYDSTQYAAVIERMRSSFPEAMFGADVIVGFPGEKDIHFRETYNLIEKLGIQHLHVFRYSSRPGVAAERLKDDVPGDLKRTRSRQLYQLGEKNKGKFISSFVGKRLRVLFEEEIEKGVWRGFSGNFINCFINCQENLKNQVWEVEGLKSLKNKLKVSMESDECIS